jgi:hypothetical protein
MLVSCWHLATNFSAKSRSIESSEGLSILQLDQYLPVICPLSSDKAKYKDVLLPSIALYLLAILLAQAVIDSIDSKSHLIRSIVLDTDFIEPIINSLST